MPRKGWKRALDGKFYPSEQIKDRNKEFKTMKEGQTISPVEAVCARPIDMPVQVEQREIESPKPIKEVEPYPFPYVKKNCSEPKRRYYFENRRQPGKSLSFFGGNAPVKGRAPSDEDLKSYHLEHGTEVSLTEKMARHIKDRGTMKPIMEEDGFGTHPTGRKYLDRRFDLHEV